MLFRSWDVSNDEPAIGTTIGERVSMWMKPDAKPVGDTLNKLKEVFHRGHNRKMHIVKFEELCEDPEKEMRKIYDYLELPYYHIDYNNVKQVTHEDDKFHGKYGDHKINPKIEPTESRALDLLGNVICKELYQRNKWYFDYFEYKF